MEAQHKAEIALNMQLDTNAEHIVLYTNTPQGLDPNQIYLQGRHLAGTKTQAGLGDDGWNRLNGLFRIFLWYPKNDRSFGQYEAHLEAGDLIDAFKRGTYLTYDGVVVRCENAQRTTDIDIDSWYVVPVEVTWFAYAEN